MRGRKTKPIGTASAERLDQALVGEPLDHPGGARSGQNIRQGLPEKIPQGQHAIAIQAAGNHCAVHKDGQMIAQTVTMASSPHFRGQRVRPGELALGVEKDARCKRDAPAGDQVRGMKVGKGKHLAEPREETIIPCPGLPVHAFS